MIALLLETSPPFPSGLFELVENGAIALIGVIIILVIAWAFRAAGRTK